MMTCAQPVAIFTHSPIWRSVKIGRITFKAWINLAVVSVTASRKDSIIWTAIHNHLGISLGGKRLFRLSSMPLCQQCPQNQISQPEGSPPAGHHSHQPTTTTHSPLPSNPTLGSWPYQTLAAGRRGGSSVHRKSRQSKVPWP